MGLETKMGQIIVNNFVGSEEFLFGASFDWNRGNVVGIVAIEDEKISVATVGCDGEVAHLVGEEKPSDFVGVHEDKVCHCVSRFLNNEIRVVFGDEWSGGGKRMGWPLALAGLVHVSFLPGIVDGDVLACVLGGEARETFYITLSNSIDQSGDNRGKKASMV